MERAEFMIADRMTSRGSDSNVLAALYNFLLVPMERLSQGRLIVAALHFLIDVAFWLFLPGWFMQISSAYSAAVNDPPFLKSEN